MLWLPARRRPEFLTRFPVGAQLVIGTAFVWITQYFVGFGQFLEAFLGVGFLADIGMIFTGQATDRLS